MFIQVNRNKEKKRKEKLWLNNKFFDLRAIN